MILVKKHKKKNCVLKHYKYTNTFGDDTNHIEITLYDTTGCTTYPILSPVHKFTIFDRYQYQTMLKNFISVYGTTL